MRQLIAFVLLGFTLLVLLVSTAEAARFGGGRSFGTQRAFTSSSRFQQAGPRSAPFYNQARPRSSWAAPLAGLALGSMLGYFMMGHGLGSGLLSWLALALVAFLLFNLFRSKFQNTASFARLNPEGQGRVFNAQSAFQGAGFNARESTLRAASVEFNQDAFLREAKVQFIRLQAAYDAGNLDDLRAFTSPEVFAEIKIQLQERGPKANHTEVVSLNAELKDLTTEQGESMATVKFSGVLREEPTEPAQFFEEVWHFHKTASNPFRVVGVQQNQH